ncbi:uncharacterized protein DNG_04372 [Cephalotrichum gorgonifer]|uniref:Uncharacterized protein n=1 Tax=Cephalotrichum gorgonifer TaxID=2041049 RepID=A0AAE8MXW1_9PEZI|nr:uncharacterized protein DNG_04372 [Cephalotrichum gorgonifer]
MSVSNDSDVDSADLSTPPPPSQSHFAKFDNFVPDDGASFDHEFARLASSQEWAPSSREYIQERTIAMREELKYHYFSQSQRLGTLNEELTEEQKLAGYQDLCREVGIPAMDSVDQCKKQLKNTLVNIVDLIDARRTKKGVKVWDNFEAFRTYTLRDGYRIDKEEAKKGEGFLASLLQHLRVPRGRRRGGGKRSGFNSRVFSGRVTKKTQA